MVDKTIISQSRALEQDFFHKVLVLSRSPSQIDVPSCIIAGQNHLSLDFFGVPKHNKDHHESAKTTSCVRELREKKLYFFYIEILLNKTTTQHM